MTEERLDARRNRRAVLDAAIEVLSEDAGAGMAEIAARSGVTRTTVYRHFPTREALIAAVLDVVSAAERAVVRDAIATGPGTEQVFRALATGIVSVGLEFRALAVHAGPEVADDLRHPSDEEPLLVWLTAEAAASRLTTALPPTWIYSMIHGTARAAVEDVQAARRSATEAGELLGETFVRTFCRDD